MPETVKVRIAVAVDPQGQWACAGWEGAKDDDMISSCRDFLEYGDIVYWLSAELAVPKAQDAMSTVDQLGCDKDLRSAIEYAIECMAKYGGILCVDAVDRLAALSGVTPPARP